MKIKEIPMDFCTWFQTVWLIKNKGRIERSRDVICFCAYAGKIRTVTGWASRVTVEELYETIAEIRDDLLYMKNERRFLPILEEYEKQTGNELTVYKWKKLYE